jgi:hypothetical protein
VEFEKEAELLFEKSQKRPHGVRPRLSIAFYTMTFRRPMCRFVVILVRVVTLYSLPLFATREIGLIVIVPSSDQSRIIIRLSAAYF